MTDYNIEGIKHLGFIINGENIWTHWGALCFDTNVMLLVTQIAFATMVQLVKAKCKRKFFNPFYFS